MSHDRDRSEETLFAGALALPPAAREAYLAQACGGNEKLRAAVQALLAAHDAAGEFLPSAVGHAAATAILRTEEKPGDHIGHYKLLQQIGEGGCGIVYMAEQEEPVRRRVALKVIKLGMDTKAVVARFEAERQALAMMDHPNIAKVFDAGATSSGRPYFVMELVRGVPITKYCDEVSLSTEQRLELFSQVCSAIQHAHQKGIIHRDIKPSNILVTLHDGVPVPKVIDFGIAKATHGRLTDQTMFTAFEQFIGTPAYMSPEQAEMSGLDIDTRSDIYSLGVLLYELLAGRPPFEPKAFMQAGLDEMRRMIREIEPPKPSKRLSTLTDIDRTTVARLRGTAPAQLTTVLSGDLDWIVMRCLEKDRTRRYGTPTELVADIQRHLKNEPVTARPPNTLYLLSKLVRRHRVAVATAATIAAALIVGLCVTTWAYFREKAAHEIAVKAAAGELRAGKNSQDGLVRLRELERQLHEREQQQMAASLDNELAANVTRALLAQLEQLPRGADTTALRASIDSIAQRLENGAQLPSDARQEWGEIIGDAYVRLEDLPRAEALYRMTHNLRRQLLGDADLATVRAWQKLAEVLKRQGKTAAAVEVMHDGAVKRVEYLASDRYMNDRRRAASELRAQGRYREAEEKMLDVLDALRRRGTPEQKLYPDVGRIARIRLDAGDLAGASRLANQWLAAEKDDRFVSLAFINYLIVRDSYDVPFLAHQIAGLTALQRGDIPEAERCLIASIDPWRLSRNGGFQTDLLYALAKAGHTDVVLRFLAIAREAYRDVYESERLQFIVFADDWSRHYFNIALGREQLLLFDEWGEDVRAGRIPESWKPKQPAVLPGVADAVPLPPLPEKALPKYVPIPWFARPEWPVTLLLLGWFSSAALPLLPRRGWRSQLSQPALRLLALFCLVRFADVALSAAMLFSDRFMPSGALSFGICLANWVVLWEFVRVLAPDQCTTRETRGARWLAAVVAGAAYGALFLPALAPNTAILVTCFVLLGLSVLGIFALSISVSVAAGPRLCRWAWRNSGTRLGKIFSVAAAGLIVWQGATYVLLPALEKNFSREFAVATLWLNALLPWCLALAFAPFWRRVAAPAT